MLNALGTPLCGGDDHDVHGQSFALLKRFIEEPGVSAEWVNKLRDAWGAGCELPHAKANIGGRVEIVVLKLGEGTK
jgi:hypothetical protein